MAARCSARNKFGEYKYFMLLFFVKQSLKITKQTSYMQKSSFPQFNFE